MRAFIYQIGLNWKLNLRSKELLVHYYVVPLVFYLFTKVNYANFHVSLCFIISYKDKENNRHIQ